jgi:hypothetical protein
MVLSNFFTFTIGGYIALVISCLAGCGVAFYAGFDIYKNYKK